MAKTKSKERKTRTSTPRNQSTSEAAHAAPRNCQRAECSKLTIIFTASQNRRGRYLHATGLRLLCGVFRSYSSRPRVQRSLAAAPAYRSPPVNKACVKQGGQQPQSKSRDGLVVSDKRQATESKGGR